MRTGSLIQVYLSSATIKFQLLRVNGLCFVLSEYSCDKFVGSYNNSYTSCCSTRNNGCERSHRRHCKLARRVSCCCCFYIITGPCSRVIQAKSDPQGIAAAGFSQAQEGCTRNCFEKPRLFLGFSSLKTPKVHILSQCRG